LTETVVPLPMLPDPFNPVFFTATGDIVGAISAPGPGQGQQ
jgi:hypothetical protein